MLAVELVGFYWGRGIKLCFVGKSASVEPQHSVPLAAAGLAARGPSSHAWTCAEARQLLSVTVRDSVCRVPRGRARQWVLQLIGRAEAERVALELHDSGGKL